MLGVQHHTGEARRKWETLTDVEREREVLEILKRCCPFDVAHKLPTLYQLDYTLERNHELVALADFEDESAKICAFTEIKSRKLPFGYGDGYYIALSKLAAAKHLYEISGLPCLLLVRFADGYVYWAYMHHPVSRSVWHGRKDRPYDPLAFEPCGVMSWCEFRKIGDD